MNDRAYRRANSQTQMLELTDTELAVEVSRSLSSPRTVDDSFTLHAPLELLARLALLPVVDPSGREMARRRMVSLATNYESQGERCSTRPHRIRGPLRGSGIEREGRRKSWIP